jgi:hypothetical protein
MGVVGGSRAGRGVFAMSSHCCYIHCWGQEAAQDFRIGVEGCCGYRLARAELQRQQGDEESCPFDGYM